MRTLPPAMIPLVAPCTPLFSARGWRHALVLLAGARRAPGQRTGCAALRALGLHPPKPVARYQRVLHRATGSSLAVRRVLLGLPVAVVAADGPVSLGLDAPIERRRGPKSAAQGRYRYAVRSSTDDLVKVRGRRWVCALLLAPLPWAGGVWALPFLAALAPAERHDRARELWAHPRLGPTGEGVRQAAWQHKPRPTFSAALALVRRALWAQTAFCMSAHDPDKVEVPRAFVERLTDALCYAACPGRKGQRRVEGSSENNLSS